MIRPDADIAITRRVGIPGAALRDNIGGFNG
jgi:hypothetical protein